MKTFKSVLVLAGSANDQFAIDKTLKKAGVNNNIYMANDGLEAVHILEDLKKIRKGVPSLYSQILILADISPQTTETDKFVESYFSPENDLKSDTYLLLLTEEGGQSQSTAPVEVSQPQNVPTEVLSKTELVNNLNSFLKTLALNKEPG